MAIACDLCQARSDHIIRVNSWAVCQWCLNNGVLDHALDVEAKTAQLNEAVSQAGIRHRRDEADMKAAKSELESAHEARLDPTKAKAHLATSTAKSKESLRLTLVSGRALEEYRESESRKTRKARRKT
jgi:hypothetical protein